MFSELEAMILEEKIESIQEDLENQVGVGIHG